MAVLCLDCYDGASATAVVVPHHTSNSHESEAAASRQSRISVIASKACLLIILREPKTYQSRSHGGGTVISECWKLRIIRFKQHTDPLPFIYTGIIQHVQRETLCVYEQVKF